MEVFRIAQCRYITDTDGAGARLFGGRWNSKGYPVLYTSGSRALAALEVLVHIPRKNLPADFCTGVLWIPEQVKRKELSLNTLPENWRTIPLQPALQQIGDEWWNEGKYCILKVPSVVIPEEWNYLINPLHPDAKRIKVRSTHPFLFDDRLSGQRKPLE